MVVTRLAAGRRLALWLGLHLCLGASLATVTAAASHAADSTERYRYLVDSGQRLADAEAALAAFAQQPPAERSAQRTALFVSLGMQQSPTWFITPLPAGTRYVVINGGWLDAFDVAFTDGARILASYASGTAVAAAARPVDDPRFVFKPPTDSATLSLLVRHSAPGANVEYPIEFQSQAEYSRGALLLHLRHGAYYGLALLVLFYSLSNLLIAPSWRGVTLCGYLLGSLITFSVLDGFLPAYVLPTTPALVLWLSHAAVGIALAGALLFGMFFLGVNQRQPRLARAMYSLAALLLLNSLVNAFTQSALGAQIEQLGAVLASAVLIWAAVAAARAKVSAAGVYLLSRLPISLAALAVVSTDLGPGSVALVMDALFVGSALELLLLSVALATRIASDTRAKSAAENRERSLDARIKQLQLVTDEANQLRSVQRSVQEAHRVRTISQMASGVAHDFNNIFTSVLGFSELLQDPGLQLGPDQQLKYAREIHTAGQRGAKLVDQLLIYSRSAKPDVRSIDLGEVTRDALELARRGLPKEIEVVSELPDQALACVVDANQVRQVIINLVTNASEAMAGAGVIEVALMEATIAPQQCSSCLHSFSGDRLVLSIRDTGSGVEGSIQDLFTPFHTSKPVGNGSGLGLSVVDGIVHEHGGHLLMANRGSRSGTRVDVCLPCDRAAGPAIAQSAQLLLVTSNTGSARAAQDKLGRYYQLTCAERASTALEMFLDNRQRFGLVVVDLQDGEGRGLELAGDIRSTNPRTPVLFLTTDDGTGQMLPFHSQLQQSEITRVLNLSTDFDSLLATVEALLHPVAPQTENIASLRDALRRMQKQPS